MKRPFDYSWLVCVPCQPTHTHISSWTRLWLHQRPTLLALAPPWGHVLYPPASKPPPLSPPKKLFHYSCHEKNDWYDGSYNSLTSFRITVILWTVEEHMNSTDWIHTHDPLLVQNHHVARVPVSLSTSKEELHICWALHDDPVGLPWIINIIVTVITFPHV